MPDYIYLLENRLSADQQSALRHLREAAREAGLLLFLTGDAVRDLTSGHAVRDLELAIQGNALKLRKPLEKLGAKVWGDDSESRSLYLCFPGTVRVDLVSTHRCEYPKPGKPAFHASSIQDDLRRRDFTVNAMAISLNEGSFGLLMDPLNGAADIEARTLRLVSNYGFLEQPSLLIRATRYRARLGWELDPRTQQRYDNAKEEGVIEHLSAHERSRELEQIGHEDDGLKVMRAHEAEGWMKLLFPSWTSARVDEEKLKALHDLTVDLLAQGVHPDMSAAQMQLLTAKLPSKDLTALKKLMLRPGFVEEWNSLDSIAAAFAKQLAAKDHQTPSACYKLFTTYDPEAVLWLGFTAKDAAVRNRYEQFLRVWPEARQRIPYAQMQEMRITPELPKYGELLEQIFLQLIDGKLTTPEETKAFLEPYSPPAPPPQITIKRSRVKRSAEAKVKERSFEDEDESEEDIEETDLDDISGDEDELDLGLGKDDLDQDLESEEESEEEEEVKPARGKSKSASNTAPAPAAKAKSGTKAEVAKVESKESKPVASRQTAEKSKQKEVANPVRGESARPATSKTATKPAPKPSLKPVKAAKTKPAPRPAPKPVHKAAHKPAAHKAIVKSVKKVAKSSKPTHSPKSQTKKTAKKRH